MASEACKKIHEIQVKTLKSIIKKWKQQQSLKKE
jgi:hypothetical protein